MQRLRSEFDADRITEAKPTPHKTDVNVHPLTCETCGAKLYVDEKSYDEVRKAVEGGLEDNPFVCPDCEREDPETMYVR